MIDYPYVIAMNAAHEIADDMISVARSSGPNPIAWVTGNPYMPPLRAYAAADQVWKTPRAYWESGESDAWEVLTEELERLLSKADVVMDCPDYDNSIYVVDLARFEYVESESDENLQDDWRIKP